MARIRPTPQEVVNDIRLQKFGLAEDGRRVSRNPLSADLHRAIQHLSEDLYSKDIHFVLELIQNAEDNDYRPGVRPDLSLVLSSRDPTGTSESEGALILVNNEMGFTPSNVRALCAVGETTKEKRQGYIGEKGIGFKSVFLVSAEPHIFSAGYQFRFREKPDPIAGMGYIVPYWVPDVPGELRPYAGKTTIVLPLKRGKWQEVAESLEHIAPETILFLSKVQGLTIEIEGRDPIEVLRDDTQRPLVQFMHGDEYAEFWVAECEIPVPADVREEKRQGVTTRTVSVACPLTDDEPDGAVFAFLPTEMVSGLPFLVNADFILSSSRERIQMDRPWNRWLRDNLAEVFVEAFEAMLGSREHRANAYSFIPLADDIQEEFFEPVVEVIHAKLGERPVVWTFGNKEPLLKPCQVRLCPAEIRDLLKPNPLPSQLHETPLVHPAIEVYSDQLEAIGVTGIIVGEVLNCLRDEAWLSSQELGWFTQLYSFLSQSNVKPLDGLPLLPVQSEELTSTAERSVYFPNGGEDILALYDQVSANLTIDLLDPQLYEEIRKDEALLGWVGDTLGVKTLSQASFCLDLAQMLNEHCEDVSVTDLANYTRHIRDHYQDIDEDTRKEIVKLLPVALADGQIARQTSWRAHRPLVMPERMDRATGWQLVFPDAEDRADMAVLSDAYLRGCKKDSDRGRWRTFLRALGATEAPRPRRITWEWRWTTDMPADIDQVTLGLLRGKDEYSTRSEKLTDWRAPQWLDELWRGGRKDKLLGRRCKALLGCLEEWARQEAQPGHPYHSIRLGDARYEWHYRWWREKRIDSGFMARLIEAPWFPSSKGPMPPGQVFLDRPEVREMFGDALPYALENPSDTLARLIGLHQTATIDEVLAYLEQLASQPPGKASRTVAAKIYAFLAERWRADIAEQFATKPLILVARPEPRWVTSGQALWPDLSSVFGDTFAYLEHQFDNRLRGFFVERLGVREELGPKLYADALIELAGTPDADPTEVKAALERIYPELRKVAEEDTPPEWWGAFAGGAKIWTQDERFKPAGEVFVPDDGDLKRVLGEEGVQFAWRPEKASFAEYQALYQALGVRSLAASVRASAEYGDATNPGDVPCLLTQDMRRAVCYYLWNVLPNGYRWAKDEGLLEQLLRTQEQWVASLNVTYVLDGTRATAADAAAYWPQKEPVFYLCVACPPEQLEVEVCAIIARRLLGNRPAGGLENLVGRMLGASEAKAQSLIDKHNWALAADERTWLESLLEEPPPAGGTEEGEEDEGELETGPELAVAPETEGDGEWEGEAQGEQEFDAQPAAQVGGSTRGYGGHTAGARGEPRRRSRDEERVDLDAPVARQTRRSSSSGRWRSYPEPETTERAQGAGGAQAEERKAIEEAGMRVAMAYEREQGWAARDVSQENRGYDIHSSRGLGEVRCIEVKALSGEWARGSPAALTDHEFDVAQGLGQKFWLYVVEQALSDSPQLVRVSDPANRVNQYCFDDGWKALAERTGDS